MVLWILQFAFDFAVAALALVWLVSGRRHQTVTLPAAPLLAPPEDQKSLRIETPLGYAVSTLAETAKPETDRMTNDAYEKAEQLVAKGIPLREISRQTGLSMSELQLLGKMTQRDH